MLQKLKQTLVHLYVPLTFDCRCEDPMVAIRYDDLFLAFEFSSAGLPMEHNAYISIDTGQIHWDSEWNPMEEEVPDDLETSDRYIAVPHKNDLDLGRILALRFVEQVLPERYGQAEAFFRKKGAYARFKRLLESEGVLEKWYKFETEAVDKALRGWCAENDIQLVGNGDEPSAKGTS